MCEVNGVIRSFVEGNNSLCAAINRVRRRMNPSDRMRLSSKKIWTRKGWTRIAISEEEKQALASARRRQIYQPLEFATDIANSERTMVREVGNSVQIKSPLSEIDDLPGALKDVMQQPYTWYTRGTKMFRIIDEETQALDGECGTDIVDSDDAENMQPTYMCMLERSGAVQEDTTPEELLACIPMSEEDRESNSTISNTIREGYAALMQHESSHSEREILELAMEQEIEQTIGSRLVDSVNSPFCGRGYVAPATKFQFAMLDQPHAISRAAEERKDFFYTLLAEAASISSIEELYGAIDQPDEWDEEDHEIKRKGFYGKLYYMYQHDKNLHAEWGKEKFEADRTQFIKDWRERWSCQDEESLRIALWVQFDRDSISIRPVFDEDGKRIKNSKNWKDSIWKMRKSWALRDLFLTKTQWAAIYDMCDIVKRRLRIQKQDTDRIEATNTIKQSFKDIETLKDLYDHKRMMSKRGVKGKKIIPSVIDRISLQDENLWVKSYIQKQRRLEQQLQLFNSYSERATDIQNTEEAEIAISCPYPDCNSMVISSPKSAKLGEEKKLFAECEECGKKIWL